MIRFLLAFAALTVVPLATVEAAAKPAPRSPTRDWASTVAITSEGGFRMGNPSAPVKLVEYGSLACPHCRHFEETGYKPLVERYVRTGRVSYEFRNLLLNGPDIAVSLLTRCSGPTHFFGMAELVFERQPEWEGKIQQGLAAKSEARRTEMDKMTEQQRIAFFAELGDLKQLGTAFGVTASRARQCLSDPKALQRLLAMTEMANKAGIGHTPTFLVNGKVTDASTWDDLEPLIRQAGAH